MNREELEFSISQFSDGTLPDEQRQPLENLLAHDAEAQRLLAEDRSLTDLLRSGPALPQVNWDRLAKSISQAIDADLEERVAKASWWMRMRLPSTLAIAASTLLAVGLTSFFALRFSRSGGPVHPIPSEHQPVAMLMVEGPRPDAPDGPVVSEISVSAGGSYAKDSSLSPYADELADRPSRVVIASGMNPDRPAVGFPY